MGYADDVKASKREKQRAAAERRKAKAGKDFQWRGFANLTVGEQHKQHFEGWLQQDDICADFLADTLTDVGKLSLSFDRRAECFVAAITVTNMERPDGGLCTTARSVDPFKALWRVVYVYWHIAAGDLSAHAEGGSAYTDDAW